MYNWAFFAGLRPLALSDNSSIVAGRKPNAPTFVPGISGSRLNLLLALLGLSVVINYIDRSNLSIAAPLIKDELGLSATQLGTLLSAFFYTYCLMQIPAGWLVDRLDVKRVFAAGFFLWSAATAVTGGLHGFLALLTIRIILGVGESVAFPACSKILAGHFPESRRGMANSVIIAGLALGPAVGLLIGGTAVERWGWRSFFLTLGVAGLLWLIPWWFLMPSRQSQTAEDAENDVGIVPMLRQRSAWGACLGQFSINYYLYFLVTWLPFYLVRGRGLSLKAMSWYGALLFLTFAGACGLSGKLSDLFRARGFSNTEVCKTAMGLGCAGVGVSLVLIVISYGWAFPATLALTGAFMGMSGSHCWVVAQILAGRQMAGRWTGLQNFVGNFAGAVAPTLAGFLLDRTGSFLWPFAITGAVALVGALSWTLIVDRIEQIDWDRCR